LVLLFKPTLSPPIRVFVPHTWCDHGKLQLSSLADRPARQVFSIYEEKNLFQTDLACLTTLGWQRERLRSAPGSRGFPSGYRISRSSACEPLKACWICSLVVKFGRSKSRGSRGVCDAGSVYSLTGGHTATRRCTRRCRLYQCIHGCETVSTSS